MFCQQYNTATRSDPEPVYSTIGWTIDWSRRRDSHGAEREKRRERSSVTQRSSASCQEATNITNRLVKMVLGQIFIRRPVLSS